LKDIYMKGADIKISEPIVPLCETITGLTGQDGHYPNLCCSKSPNKLNRVYATSQPLNDKLILAMEKKEIMLNTNMNDIKDFAKEMNEKYDIDSSEARKIWTFGCPPDAIPNMIVDQTKGIQYLNTIKDHVIGAMMQVTTNGILCEETMRGIRYNIMDVKIHSDPVHRGASQIIPCCKNVFYACEIASQPRLMEPMFMIEINCNKECINSVYQTINNKRGIIGDVIDRMGNDMLLKGYIPVMESFDFTEILRKNTGGKAQPQMIFSHWQIINNDPFQKDTLSNKLMLETRKRKGLKVEKPNFNDYYDKI
jgi:elongation factor 2